MPATAPAASGAPATQTAPPDAAGEAPCATPVVLVVGMAGSGKTTLVNALACFLDGDGEGEDVAGEGAGKADGPVLARAEARLAGTAGRGVPEGAYVVNLDPAVAELPYEPNVDIRDTVKYKEVMAEYRLGPNGAIITSLNLFATRFDQVLTLLERRAPEVRAVIMDTPGQIETFTWSASGAIITEAVAAALPTVVLFVVDTPRSESAMTFVSNMLYACSIMYKTRLPMVIVFNKIDVTSSSFAEAWMRDFDAFDAALREDNFAGTLARSMAQALEEFYSAMRCASVSAVTEEGLDDLMAAIAAAAAEYETEYRPALLAKRESIAASAAEHKAAQLAALRADLDSERVAPPPAAARDTAWAPAPGAAADADGGGAGEYAGRGLLQPPPGGDGYAPGVGARRLEALRRAGVTPPVGGALVDPGEGGDPEDAAAYADFVKYLEALKVKDAAEAAAATQLQDGNGGAGAS